MNREQFLIDGLSELVLLWNSMSDFERLMSRSKLLQGNDGDKTLCQTSGSSTGTPKKYWWGPDFFTHVAFYNLLFCGKQSKHVHVTYACESSFQSGLLRIEQDHIKLVVGKGGFNNVNKISGMSIITNPEQLYILALRYPSLLEDVFDISTCRFCFTGCALLQEYKDLFSSHGMWFGDHMRSWDGGATFYTCEFGSVHLVDMASDVKVEEGKLISTDGWNLAQDFIGYWNGDMVKWNRSPSQCSCGMSIDQISFTNPPQRSVPIGNGFLSYDTIAMVIGSIIDTPWVNVGFNHEKIVIHYHCSHNIDVQDKRLFGLQETIKGMSNGAMSLSFVNGLNDSQWKIKRVFKIPDA